MILRVLVLLLASITPLIAAPEVPNANLRNEKVSQNQANALFDMDVNASCNDCGEGRRGLRGPTGEKGITGPKGKQGPVGATGFKGENGRTGRTGRNGENGTIGGTGNTGAIGSTGPCCSGSTGSKGPSGPTGPTGAIGAVGATGPIGATGAMGTGGGAVGPIGATGPANGPPGSAGTTGPCCSGPTGATGASGTAGGALEFADFFAIMTNDPLTTDNLLGVSQEGAIEFPKNGPASGLILRASAGTSPDTFILTNPGTYEINWQVSVSEPAQLALNLSAGTIPLTSDTVVGRDTGFLQIVGLCIITTQLGGTTLQVINHTTTSPLPITITKPSGGVPIRSMGTQPVSAHLIIKRIH